METNAAGTVIAQCTYAPFGQVVTCPTDDGANHYRFTGQERDTETGLDNFRAREFMSQFGRFSQPDPAGLAAVDPGNPQTWNRYAYTANNPTNFVDPSGMYQCGWSYTSGWAGEPPSQHQEHWEPCYADDYAGYTQALAMALNGVSPFGLGMMPCGYTGSLCQNTGGGGGGNGNKNQGFFHKLGERLACAADYGDAHSLASVTGTQNSFLGKAFLGNTFSGLTQLTLLATGGPSTATTKDVAIAVLSGTHQGLPGGGNVGKGPLGVAQDAIVSATATATYNAVVGTGTQTLELGINASGKVATAAGGLSETAAGTVAGVVGGVKLAGDLAVFGYGFYKCH